ncbi:MAG: 3'-5' exonuclease [Tetrasphaera sp.]|nr:3'-5' exonuclease [Tetrasphaera sp.]
MRWWRRATPWGADLDGDWRSTRFTVIDVETTGLDLEHDEIVSIGAVDVRDARLDVGTAWYQPVQPTCEIATEALKVHSLTRDELAAAPRMPEVIAILGERLRGSVLVAHAAWIERAFLDRALAPLGQRVPNGIIDTAGLARQAGLWESRDREPNLELLARQLDLPVFTPHHALGDAMTTAVVLLVLATRLGAMHETLRTRDLVEMSRSGR